MPEQNLLPSTNLGKATEKAKPKPKAQDQDVVSEDTVRIQNEDKVEETVGPSFVLASATSLPPNKLSKGQLPKM